MSYIVRYRKFTDADRTVEIALPSDADGKHEGMELATIDGETYVSLPDGSTLPVQPSEISIEQVAMSPELKASISEVSPFVRMIRQMVSEKIASRYSTGDEIKLLRTAPSAEFEAYNAYVEDCRAWGREQKSKVGL